MKFLLVLLVVVVGLWLLLRGRSKPGRGDGDNGAAPKPQQPSAAVTEMVACAHCGLHLPRHDALADGRGLLFCGSEHRDAGPA